MKIFLRRATVILLTFSMIMSGAYAAVLESGIEKTVGNCTYEILFDNDFESGVVGFTVKGQASANQIDEAYGASMKVPLKGSSTTFYKEFEKPVTDGLLYVAYDHYKTAQAGRTFDVLYDRPAKDVGWLAGTYISGMYWNGTYQSYADNLDVLSTYDQSVPWIAAPPAETWVHIDYWYDMDNRMVYAYMNGKEYFVTKMMDSLNQITTIGHIANVNGLAADEYFDNYKIIHFKNGFDESAVPGAQYIPDYVKASLHTVLETEKLGNNFFTKDITFDVPINNTLDAQQTADVDIKVINDYGNCVYEKSEKVVFEPNTEKRLTHSFTAENYGFYDVFANVNTDSGKQVKLDVRNRISCLAKPEKQNPIMGINDHPVAQRLGYKEWDRKMEMLKNAGMSMVREGLVQHMVRDASGEYKRQEPHIFWESTAAKHGISHMVLLDGEASNRLPTADNPKATEEFAKYVTAMVKEMKGRTIYFEVGNEPNYIAGFNSNELVKTNYVHALRTAYKAAKAVNPDCEIMALCVCEYDMDYIEAFLSAGVADCMDGLSIHPYMLTQSPEQGGMYEKLQQTKELMEKYGCGDKKIYITEIGWTSAPGFTSEERKTAYQLRTQILIGHEVDMLLWYNYQYKDYVTTLRENNFGFIYGDGYQKERVPYGSHPSFLTMTHWNQLMTDSEFKERVDSGSDDVRLYKYKLADGKDVLIAYTTDEEQNRSIGLKLGCDSVEVRDMYGNPKTVYAKDGVTSVSLGFEPIYIIGSFSDMGVTESKIKLPTSVVGMINGEDTVIEIEADGCDGLPVEVGVPDGFEITENNGFANGKARVLVRSTGERSDKGKILIDIKDGDRCLFTHKCAIEYNDPISYTYKISPYSNEKAWVEIDFTNHRITPVKLELRLNAPTELASGKYVIEKIDPKGTRRLRVNIPASQLTNNKIILSGTLHSENEVASDDQSFSASVTPGFVYYTDKTPKIDGYISEGEWIEELGMVFDARNGAANMVVKEKSDFFGKGYLMCNDDYLYFAAEITDDVLADHRPAANIWDNDSIQFAFAQAAKYGNGRTEINMGIASGEPVLSRSSYMGVNKTTDVMNKFEDTEFAVRRDEKEKKTYYEIKLPWRECFDTEFDPKTRGTMAFSVCINDNDGVGVNNNTTHGRGYFEYIGGIGSSKDSGAFIPFPILKR